MPKLTKLTPKQERFVQEYLVDLNATQAAIRAGYSAKTAREQASRLLSNVNVMEAVADGKAARTQRLEITQDQVLQWHIDQYRINAKTYGKTEFDGECRSQVYDDAGLPVQEQVDAPAANKALELIGKHVGFYEKDNKTTIAGGLSIGWSGDEE